MRRIFPGNSSKQKKWKTATTKDQDVVSHLWAPSGHHVTPLLSADIRDTCTHASREGTLRHRRTPGIWHDACHGSIFPAHRRAGTAMCAARDYRASRQRSRCIANDCGRADTQCVSSRRSIETLPPDARRRCCRDTAGIYPLNVRGCKGCCRHRLHTSSFASRARTCDVATFCTGCRDSGACRAGKGGYGRSHRRRNGTAVVREGSLRLLPFGSPIKGG